MSPIPIALRITQDGHLPPVVEVSLACTHKKCGERYVHPYTEPYTGGGLADRAARLGWYPRAEGGPRCPEHPPRPAPVAYRARHRRPRRSWRRLWRRPALVAVA